MSNMRVGSGQQRQTAWQQPQRQASGQSHANSRPIGRQTGGTGGQQPTSPGQGRGYSPMSGVRQAPFQPTDFRTDFARLAGLEVDSYPYQPEDRREADRAPAGPSRSLPQADDGGGRNNQTGGTGQTVRATRHDQPGEGGRSGNGMEAARSTQTRRTGEQEPSGKERSTASDDAKSPEKPEGRSSEGKSSKDTRETDDTPKSGRGWMEKIRNANLPKTGKEWVNYVKDKLKGLLSSIRNGIAGPFRNQMDRNNGWASNVIFSGASNSQHTVGWMNPHGKTAMGYALSRSLRDSPSLVDAMNKFSGRPYPGFPRNAIAKYWHADKVGGDGYFQSPLRFSKNTQSGPNPTKNVFVGVSGGPEGAFSRSIQDIGKVMKEEFNTTNFIYHRGTARADQQIASAFGKIREYALKNPDQPVSVAFMLDTHGGTSGGNRAEGSGHGFTGQVDERTLKNLVNRYLGGLDNVGVHMIVSACHSGAYLM